MGKNRRPRRLRVDIVTLFPPMFEGSLGRSIVGRAREKGALDLGFVNPRDFVKDRHRTVDDRPYGGGAGMVLMAEPLYQAVRKVRTRNAKVVLLSPQGRRFEQKLARSFSKERHLVLICGHYEGVDERVFDFVDMELSIGDFVLTGGEIPAMVVVDAVARLLPGVLAKEDAAVRESFTGGLLDYPQFTRPRVWRGKKVPDVLLGGDHSRIETWRREQAVAATQRKRPKLMKNKV